MSEMYQDVKYRPEACVAHDGTPAVRLVPRDAAPPPVPSKAARVLDEARALIAGPRQVMYGPPERSFATIALMWTAYLGDRCPDAVDAKDVAWMMNLLKVARDATGAGSPDNPVDAAAYAALAGQMGEMG